MLRLSTVKLPILLTFETISKTNKILFFTVLKNKKNKQSSYLWFSFSFFFCCGSASHLLQLYQKFGSIQLMGWWDSPHFHIHGEIEVFIFYPILFQAWNLWASKFRSISNLDKGCVWNLRKEKESATNFFSIKKQVQIYFLLLHSFFLPC